MRDKALLTACQRYAPWLRLWVYQRGADSGSDLSTWTRLGLDDGDGPLDSIPMHASGRSAGSEVQASPGLVGVVDAEALGRGPGA